MGGGGRGLLAEGDRLAMRGLVRRCQQRRQQGNALEAFRLRRRRQACHPRTLYLLLLLLPTVWMKRPWPTVKKALGAAVGRLGRAHRTAPRPWGRGPPARRSRVCAHRQRRCRCSWAVATGHLRGRACGVSRAGRWERERTDTRELRAGVMEPPLACMPQLPRQIWIEAQRLLARNARMIRGTRASSSQLLHLDQSPCSLSASASVSRLPNSCGIGRYLGGT
jgi:hypothetical protein